MYVRFSVLESKWTWTMTLPSKVHALSMLLLVLKKSDIIEYFNKEGINYDVWFAPF